MSNLDAPLSSRSPTSQPTRLRHWVAYHSPDVMGYEFFECEGFGVLTNKRVRDLEGDIIWVVGRLGGTRRYFLDSRFRVQSFRECDDDTGFAFRADSDDGFLFFPTPEITRKAWFMQLMKITSGLSVGLQAIYDPVVLQGLAKEYAEAQAVQSGAPESSS